MQLTPAVLLLTIALISTTSQNQGQRTAPSARPNFSGVWMGIPGTTPEPPPNTDDLPVQVDWSSPVTITQDETTLTVEYRTFSRSHALRKFIYKLDGTSTANVLTGAVDPQGRTSSAVWEGMKLVLTDAVDWPSWRKDGTTQRRLDRKILSLESPEVMRVEVSLTLGDRSSPTKLVRFGRSR